MVLIWLSRNHVQYNLKLYSYRLIKRFFHYNNLTFFLQRNSITLLRLVQEKDVIDFQNISLSLTNFKLSFSKYPFFLCPQDIRSFYASLFSKHCFFRYRFRNFDRNIIAWFSSMSINSALFGLTYLRFIGASLFITSLHTCWKMFWKTFFCSRS